MKNTLVLFMLLGLGAYKLSAQNWVSDFDDAQQIALKQNQNILLVFAGSDWCAPCIKLEREVWSSTQFQKLAQEHFVMLRADFPRKKQNKLPAKLQQKNNQLAERYNQQGNFPLVVVLNPQGQVLGKTGYKRLSPTAYFEHLKEFE